MFTLITLLDGLPYVLHKFAGLSMNEIHLGRQQFPQSFQSAFIDWFWLSSWSRLKLTLIWFQDLNKDLTTCCRLGSETVKRSPLPISKKENSICLITMDTRSNIIHQNSAVQLFDELRLTLTVDTLASTPSGRKKDDWSESEQVGPTGL